MTDNHKKLAEEFINLRNSLMKRPPSSNKRAWNLYCDWMNDSDALAAGMTEQELKEVIVTLRERVSK